MKVVVTTGLALVTQAYGSLLGHQGNFDVVGCVSTARESVAIAKEQRAHVIVFDTRGADRNEIAFLMGAREFSEVGVVLINDDDDTKIPGYEDGVYHQCTAPASKLFASIRQVGGVVPTKRDERSKSRGNNRFELSNREFEVASLVAKGYSNRKISEVVGLKEQSVKNLVSIIMRKLNCENRVQVALRLSTATVTDE